MIDEKTKLFKINLLFSNDKIIKDQLGTPSTLLNASRSTNIIYEIKGDLSDKQIEEINSIDSRQKIKDRLVELDEKSLKLKFVKFENNIFENNLTLIDSNLPQIIAILVKLFYSTKFTRTSDLVDEVSKINPLNYNMATNHPYYYYKIKRFLSDIALDMIPSTAWNGILDAKNGYIIKRKGREILCYQNYNRKVFENYLINNTKLETPSSSRHGFGNIYKIKSKAFIKLNLQIRHLK